MRAKSKYSYYVMHEGTDARLCQDGKWRTVAPFGTFSSCVKVYQRKGCAERKMDLLNCGRAVPVAYVLSLPRNQVMYADGQVVEKVSRLIDAWDEFTIEENPEGFEQARKRELQACQLTIGEIRIVGEING